jgi:hypothetical protein
MVSLAGSILTEEYQRCVSVLSAGVQDSEAGSKYTVCDEYRWSGAGGGSALSSCPLTTTSFPSASKSWAEQKGA